ncbi:MAG: phage major capsid protein [Candidatus Coproplasma sp.]
MLTLSNADAALKEYYLNAISAQLNSDVSPFFNEIEKTSQYISGKYAKCAVYNGNMNRVNGGVETAALDVDNSNSYTDITMELKNIYGGFTISDKALRASQDSSGALVNLLDAEMEGLVSDAKANFARMMYGNGNGALANVTSANTSRIYLDNVKHWFYGLNVDIIKDDVMYHNNVTVTNVNVEEKYIEISATMVSGNVGEGCIMIKHGAYNREIHGLAALFENTTLYGDDKSAIPYFKPYSAEVTELTASDVIQAISTIEDRGGGKVKMILCSHAGRKKIADLFTAAQKVVTTNDINLGYSGVYVNEIPVYADRYCPDNRIYLVNPDDFVLCQLCDWEWLSDENGSVLKQVAGKAAYSATLVKYAELICKKPCGQGMIAM